MAGFSLHVGVDTKEGRESYINDAEALHDLARKRGFMGPAKPIVGQQATYDAVTKAIEDLVAGCKPKDILLLTFATHGSSLDVTREKLHLYGRSLSDKEMGKLLSAAGSGVRIVLVVDACTSMGITTETQLRALLESNADVFGDLQTKALPPDGLRIVAFANAPFMKTSSKFSARILELAAASKGEGALEGKEECKVGNRVHGCFTGAILETMAKPPPTWEALLEAAAKRVAKHSGCTQHPAYTPYGASDDDFDALPPFQPTPPVIPRKAVPMLHEILCAMLNDEELVKEYIRLEANGPKLLKFLARFEVKTPEDIGAVRKFEADSKVFHRRLQAEIDAHFKKLTGTQGGGGLRWPGSPLTLATVAPDSIPKATPTNVRVTGYFFGNDPSTLTLTIGDDQFDAHACSETDPDVGQSTADFEVEIANAGTYDVTLGRTVGTALQESAIPSGFKVT